MLLRRDLGAALVRANIRPMSASDPKCRVGVFWDFENVRIPTGTRPEIAARRLREAVLPFGQIIESKIYYDSRKVSEQATHRERLDQSGFTLVDCPTRGTKETLDKKLIVDIMQFAHMMPQPSCVVLVTSDGDYCYTLAKINGLGVKTVVIYGPESSTPGILIDTAAHAISWRQDVLNLDLPEADLDEYSSASPPEQGSEPGGQSRLDIQPSVHDALNGNHLMLCRCIRELAACEGDWVEYSKVAIEFHQKRGCTSKMVGDENKRIMRAARESAKRGGFVKCGRKDMNSGEIVETDAPAQTDTLSTSMYVCLTPHGRMQLDIGPWDAGYAVVNANQGMMAEEPVTRSAPSEKRTTNETEAAASSPPAKRHRSECLYYKRTLCTYYERGNCKEGDKCTYAHGQAELRKSFGGLVQPCRYWNGKPGSCPHDNCLFAHDQPTQQHLVVDLADRRPRHAQAGPRYVPADAHSPRADAGLSPAAATNLALDSGLSTSRNPGTFHHGQP